MLTKEQKKLNKKLMPVLVWLQGGAKGQPFGFNMVMYSKANNPDWKGKECAETVCIFGAMFRFEEILKGETPKSVADLRDFAREWVFKNKNKDMETLACAYGLHLADMKPKKVAKVLKHFMATGITDWDIIEGDDE